MLSETSDMGCTQSQHSKDIKEYSTVSPDKAESTTATHTYKQLDSHTLASWTESGAGMMGFNTDIDYVTRNCRLQPWTTCGRHFEVLLPAPFNSDDLDVKYSYEEIQMEETGTWKNYRVKLKSSYKHLILNKYKHSPCLDVAQVIGCRDHVTVIQLVLQNMCQFLVVDTVTEAILATFETQHNNNPYLFECHISPDHSTFVLKPNKLFLLKYNISEIDDVLTVFSSFGSLNPETNTSPVKQKVTRILSSNVVVQDNDELHVEVKNLENNTNASNEIHTEDHLGQTGALFSGQSRELVLTFDPRFKHSRLVIGIQHSNRDITLSQYCLKSRKTLTQVSCGQLPGLQSLVSSPCGKIIAASVVSHVPESDAFPRKVHFHGVHLHDSDSLCLLQRLSSSGTSGLTSLTPAAIFPQFCSTGQYLALAGGNGSEVTRVDVFAVPVVMNLQHQCRLVLLQWLVSHGATAHVLPTNDTLKDYLIFKPVME